MSQHLEELDREVDTFARMRELTLTDELRTLLRDAMLWAHEEAASDAQDAAAPEDDSERRWTKVEAAKFRALTDFADVRRQWIDRLRAEAGLPERLGKTLTDRMISRLGAA